jgi:DNA-binding LytR/AlgR family response regulator
MHPVLADRGRLALYLLAWMLLAVLLALLVLEPGRSGLLPAVRRGRECANGYEAVKAVAEHQPDLLFLDIQMPKLDGFEVLELLERRPQVIFVTAYDEYAIRAFQVHAVDYLLKPFSAARFGEVVAHAEEMVRRGVASNVTAAATAVRRPLQRIAFREGGTIDVVPVQRIDYLEAQDDYVHVYSRGRKYVRQQPLGELEALLAHPLPARPPQLHRQPREPGPCRALRQRQPRGRPQRRHARAGEQGRVRAAEGGAVKRGLLIALLILAACGKSETAEVAKVLKETVDAAREKQRVVLHVRLVKTEMPSAEELEERRRLEELIEVDRIGQVVESNAGVGYYAITVEVDSTAQAAPRIEAMLREAKLSERASVRVLGSAR